MAVTRENERLYELMYGAPTAQQSAETAQAAAQLAAAEQAAQAVNYETTADGKLDKAIGDYLSRSGYRYDINNDAGYRAFAKEYSQNALRGRAAAESTARQLSGGWEPSYAGAVGSATANDIAANADVYAPVFRSLAQQEQNAAESHAANAAQLRGTIADTAYQRGRDTHGDRMNYLSYLADRYQTERQSDVQKAGFAGDVYRAQLSGALSDAETARSVDNARYQHDDLSATAASKLAADQAEFNQKLAYTKEKDAYNDRVNAQKAAAKQQQADAKAAKQLEKDKAKYAKDAWKIQSVLTGKRKLTGDMEYDLDFNHDGKVDNTDLLIAEGAAKTGTVSIPLTDTNGTTASRFISSLEGHYGDKTKSMSKETLQALMDKYKLSDADSYIVWSYFFS